jgi:outer membrane protein assembly factor BamB
VDAATGAKVWSRTFGRSGWREKASSIAIDPAGELLLVTGLRKLRGRPSVWATVAYDALTGRRAWVSRFRPDRGRALLPHAVLVAAGIAFITGNVEVDEEPYPGYPALAVAIDSSNGSVRWIHRFGPRLYRDAQRGALVHSAALSPSGTSLYLGVQVDETRLQNSMGVLAIRSATGRRRWRAAYVSPTGEQGAHPKAIAVSHDGRSLFLGGSFDVNMRFVVAFDTVDGSLEWEREVAEAGRFGELKALIVAPDGDAIYGAGTLEIDAANSPNIGIVVLALDRVSGSLLWRREWDRPGPQVDGVSDIAVRPDGSTVYVSGDAPEVTVDPELVVQPGDAATIAYDAATGDQQWTDLRDAAGVGAADSTIAIELHPDGTSVFTAGTSRGYGTGGDFAIVAYETT